MDAAGNLYIADNARQKIIKYNAADYAQYEEMDLGCYFMEFAIIDETHIALSDLYSQDGTQNKLAVYSRKDKKVIPLLQSALVEVDEQHIPRGGRIICSAPVKVFTFTNASHRTSMPCKEAMPMWR